MPKKAEKAMLENWNAWAVRAAGATGTPEAVAEAREAWFTWTTKATVGLACKKKNRSELKG